MRMTRKALLLGLALALVGAGATAQVDFSRYVALGDSLTAGVVSNGSVVTYQSTSYPALIATQAGIAASGFQQPLVAEPGLPPLLYLAALNVTPLGISPTIAMKSGLGYPLNATLPTPYNNLGIDGADTGDLITHTGNIMNFAQDLADYAAGKVGKVVPFSDLVLRFPVFPGTTIPATALAQALALEPTFLTVWIGSDDVLGAAETAVAIDGVTMTPTLQFQTEYTTLIGTLRGARPNTPIVVGNIPNVASVPFVTTIKPYIVNPANGTHIPLIGEAGPLTEQDYVTILASPLLAQGIGIPAAAGGTGLPLPEGSFDPATGTLTAGVVLRAGEVAAIAEKTTDLNNLINQVAAQFGAKVVDFNAYMNQLATTGYTYGGITLTSAYLTGGVFSYDGVHPQALGYALVAREWIKAINANFGAKLPDINLYPFLNGASATGATTVMAANVVLSQEAAVSLVKSYVPNAVTDKLQVRVRTVRRHVSAPREHEQVNSSKR
jgi:lysophospholipase L1-like esterase